MYRDFIILCVLLMLPVAPELYPIHTYYYTDIDGGSSDTLNAEHDARLHKGATGGVYYDNNKSIRDNKAADGRDDVAGRERHVAPDCPDRPVRDRVGEGWYEWSRHEARWKEDTDKDPKRPTKRGSRIRAGEEVVRRMDE